MSTASSGKPLRREDRDGVRLLIFDRPEALNAFNQALFDGVRGELEQAQSDSSIGCVILTGNGRAFSSGSDLGGEADAGEERDAAQPVPDPYDAFIATVEHFSKPLIAAVNGLAVGIGTTVLGHCDLVLAGASARFRVPFTSLGLVPEAGSTSTLPVLLGRQRATYALLSSRWISAEEAFEGGLVWRLVEDEQLLAQALAVGAEIALHPLEALIATKRLLLQARLPAAMAARALEEPEFRRLLAGPAHQEAVSAFRERRPTRFKELGVAAG